MKKIYIPFLFVLVQILFTSCITTGFKDFYKPWYEADYFPEEYYLTGEEEPIIIKTSDIDSKYREISSQWYTCIGYSGFNGPALDDDEIQQALTNLCKEQKAKVAIYSKEYTNTKTGVTSVPHTNYHYYTDAYGYRRSYTTTSYSSSSYSVDRYDFSSYIFIEMPITNRLLRSPGFAAYDLSQNDRDLYKRNTGIIVDIVYKDTPAYYANLSYGDIITCINEKPIYSRDDYIEVMSKATAGDTWNITIIRNGAEKNISLIFDLTY